MSQEKDAGTENTVPSDESVKRTKADRDEASDPAEASVSEELADEVAGKDVEAAPPEEMSEEKLHKRVAELEDRLLRTLADFENHRKRTANQFQELLRSANDQLIGELLEVMDNFERALQHTNDAAGPKDVLQGVQMIFDQMKTLLEKYDVRPIEAVGKPFDPNYHEALMQVESEEHEEGLVAVEISKGYLIGGRVLRHSKVGVSKGRSCDKEPEEERSQEG